MAEHSAIGPSALHRLLPCPASHKLSAGRKRKSSPYAATGSVAHQIIENALSDEIVMDEYPAPGDVWKHEGHEVTISDEILDGVNEMVTFCEKLKPGASKIWVEQKVDLGKLWNGSPPEPIFGTVDFGALHEDADTLYVVDYKNGFLSVFPDGNPQQNAYALGMCYEVGRFPGTVVNVIVQPNGQDGVPVKVSAMSGLDLLMWAEETLKPGVDALFGPAPAFSTGDHCRFCPARIDCPALYALARETSRTEFTKLPPEPVTLDDGALSDILNHITVIEGWFEAVRAEASQRIERGRSVPNWKLVPKRAMRRWADPAKVEKFGREYAAGVFKRVLETPTQVEKKMPRVYEKLEELGLIDKSSSGTTLVPVRDPRDAIIGKSAKEEFTALE